MYLHGDAVNFGHEVKVITERHRHAERSHRTRCNVRHVAHRLHASRHAHDVTSQGHARSNVVVEGGLVLFAVLGLLCDGVVSHALAKVFHFILTLAPVLVVGHALLNCVVLLQTP